MMLAGATSGVAATVPMTLWMEAGYRWLPDDEQYPLPPRPVAMRASQRCGVAADLDETERRVLTLVCHFGYGAAMGSLYETLLPERSRGMASGAIYGLCVWAANYLAFLPLAKLHPPPQQMSLKRHSLMIAAHLVWGTALGTLMSSGEQRDG